MNDELVEKFKEYQFTDDVIINLFNYCSQRSGLHKNYILAVANEWNKNNIKTKNDLSKYYDEQTKITKVKIIEIAKVIKSRFKLKRDITQYEQCYIEMWIEKYGYNLKIIELALNNIENLTADSFINKMDKVITEWYDKNLKTYDEIQKYIEYKM